MNPSNPNTPTPKPKTSSPSVKHLPTSKRSIFPSTSQRSTTTTTSAIEPSPSKTEMEGPSPAKIPRGPRSSLEEFRKNMMTFQEDLDTKHKAILYSVMTGDSLGAREDLDRLRRTSSAYLSQSDFVLKELQLKATATQQKLTSMENYNPYLHRENNNLRENIAAMRREMAEKDAVGMFEDDFVEEDLDKEIKEGTGSVSDEKKDIKEGTGNVSDEKKDIKEGTDEKKEIKEATDAEGSMSDEKKEIKEGTDADESVSDEKKEGSVSDEKKEVKEGTDPDGSVSDEKKEIKEGTDAAESVSDEKKEDSN